MPLPNTGMSFTPFDPLPASDLNDLVENIEALAAGTGLDTAVVTGDKLATANSAYLAFSPGGNTDYSSDTIGDWISVGNMTIPAWATKARVQVSITGFYTVTGAGTFQGNLKIGTVNGRLVDFISSSSGVGEQISVSWADEISLSGTGVQAVVIRADRESGTNALRADTGTDVTMIITYHS